MTGVSNVRLSIAIAAALVAHAASAQSPGLVYPAQRPGGPSTVAAPAAPAIPASASAQTKIPAATLSSVIPPQGASGNSAAVAQQAVSQQAMPAQSSTANSPLPASATAPVIQPKSSYSVSEAQLTAPPLPATPPALPAEPPPPPKVSVQKRADGSRVIRSEVSPAMAQAEASVAQQLPIPSIAPVPSVAAAAPSMAGGMQGIGAEVKPLPKWVTSSLDRTSGRNQIIVLPGVTEIVRIARGFPNRFTTPFDNAEVVTTDENLTHDGVAGSVIVATAADRPIGIFIQDKNSDRAIPLVLIPEDIPQRDIRLLLDDSWGPPQLRNIPDNSNSTPPSGQSEYVEYLKSIMRSLALGDIPDGHALSPLQPEAAPVCQMPGLSLRLGQMLEGSRSRIAIYKATNQSQGSIPVQEAGCYRSGVLAVSAFPRPVLDPGQDTEVYVVLRKDAALSNRGSNKRRPMLVGQ